jgi:very-short-patch-repair endonuclease
MLCSSSIGRMAVIARDIRPFDPMQPFSRADARAAGIARKTLLSSRFHKVFYDCYVSSTVPLSTRLRAKAALAISAPGSFVSHATAARIWGGIVSDPSEVHVTVPSTAVRSSRQGVKAHAGVIGAAVTRFRNLPISTPEQTFLDLATCLDLVALVVLGDSLIKAGRTTAAALRDAALSWRGRGAKLARRAARYVRDGVDSAMETRLRMLLMLAGLPAPDVNFILRHSDGSWWMRFDLCYPSLKLIIEYDGRQHAQDDEQWLHDLKRREALDRMGWRIIVVTRHDYYDTPEEVLRRVGDALIERGMVGVRRRFKTEWMRHIVGA